MLYNISSIIMSQSTVQYFSQYNYVFYSITIYYKTTYSIQSPYTIHYFVCYTVYHILYNYVFHSITLYYTIPYFMHSPILYCTVYYIALYTIQPYTLYSHL